MNVSQNPTIYKNENIILNEKIIINQSKLGSTRLKSIFSILLAFIAFSLPLETILPYYFNTRTHVYYLTIIALVFAVLFYKHIFKKVKRAIGLLLIILSFAINISIYFIDPIRINEEYKLIIQVILFSIIYLFISDNPFWRYRIIWSYWFGWFILCILSIIFYETGNVSTVYYGSMGTDRVTNILGYTAAQHGAQISTGLLTAFILTIRQKKSILKIFYTISVLIGFVVILITSSRTANISLMVVILLYFLIEIGSKKIYFIQKNLLTIIIIFFGSFILLTQTEMGTQLLDDFISRLNLTIQEGNTSGRVDIWQAGFRLIKSNPWIILIGVGQGNSQYIIGSFLSSHPQGIELHNYFFRIFIEGGLISFSLFSIGIYLIIRKGWAWYRFSGEKYYLYPLILLLIIGLSGRPFHYKIFWFFLAFNVITPLKYFILSESTQKYERINNRRKLFKR